MIVERHTWMLAILNPKVGESSEGLRADQRNAAGRRGEDGSLGGLPGPTSYRGGLRQLLRISQRVHKSSDERPKCERRFLLEFARMSAFNMLTKEILVQ